MGRSSDGEIAFIDEARIYVEGGRGGNGCCSFRREKFIPRGGPDGGCGGRGGNVILVAGGGRNTLWHFQRNRHFRAGRGGHGSGKNKTGKQGEDLFIAVPPGTVVRDDDGNVIGDLVFDGEELLVARGGRGGRGNRVFATARRQAPRFAEKGEPGQALWIRLELRLIAEVGLIGYPNVGKSTLLSRLSHAKPKIASYPFTTLAPKLGVVAREDRTFTMADLPGLIEGAASGKGLGDRFLRHANRTRLLLHLIDVSGWEGRDPASDYGDIRRELELHHPDLAAKPELVVANKMDVPGAEEKLESLRRAIDREVLPVSAAVGIGLDELVRRIFDELDKLPSEVPREEIVKVHKAEPVYSIEADGDTYRVTGSRIERLVAMTDIENEEARARMELILARLGLYESLEKAGCRPGDTVVIGDFEFEYA